MSKTIVALATAQGVAGLAVVRISGSEAFSIADKCFRSKKRISEAHTHTILYGAFIDNDTIIDNVTASVFHSPRSYTGENTVEFGVHGGAIIPMQIISSLIKHGGEHAQPGEFTKLAFVNGKLDLVQAEAVADLIHSISTPSAAISARQIRGLITSRLATLRNKLIDAATMIELEMDFAEEDILLTNTDKVANLVVEATKICCDLMNSYQSATILRDGFMVAIAGKPNAGKSTLFNSLLNLKRAIVSEIPGTTRDYITELIYLNDIPIKLVDTAGLRSTFDNIESEGIKYSLNILEEANLILLVNDCSEANDCATLHKTIREKFKDKQIIVVQNKIDLCEEMFTDCEENPCEMYYISAKTLDDKLNILKQRISEIAHNAAMQSNDILLNERQYYKLSDIKQSLNTIRLLLKQNTINEILSIEIRNAGRLLDEFSGRTWNEEVLTNVFSKFCIGK